MLEYTPDRRLTGGLRLPAHKAESTAKAIVRGFMPRELVLSLRQHRGPAAEPIVQVGQRVLKREMVAAAQADDSAAVHASTSGVVRAIEERPVPLGSGPTESLCIVIEVDGEDRPLDVARIGWPRDRAEQLKRLREGGIVGLGGAVFPTAQKLAARQCKLLIVNGAECEPYISCDDMLMREAAREIIEGSMIMFGLLSAGGCVIAIERDKPQAIEAVDRAAKEFQWPELRVAELASIYPAGGERQLVEMLGGEEVPAELVPSDIGYVCQNVGTAFAVQRLAKSGEPLISRIVTVTGFGVSSPQNVEVRLGTPIAELIAFCGGYRGDVVRLIHGGSMMGYALPSDELPITKASNCIIAATSEEVRYDLTEWPCIRCGECSIACPVQLEPQDLLLAARAADFGALEHLELKDCIECGVCDAVCPSHIPLTELFRRTKKAASRHEQRMEFSNESENRFQLRVQRQRLSQAETKSLQEHLIRELEADDRSKEASIRAAIDRSRRRRDREGDPGAT